MGWAPGAHRLEIVALGTKNPVSSATLVWGRRGCSGLPPGAISGLDEGSGPAGAQRVIFGYVNRKDYVDSAGNAWRPATEFIFRIRAMADLVPIAFWTDPRIQDVAGTPDSALYRYGIHGRDFTAYFTVAPTQTYHVRLKFCQAQQPPQPGGHATNVEIQDKPVVTDMDIAATGRRFGQGRGPGVQRRAAKKRHHCDSLLAPFRRQRNDPGDRGRPRGRARRGPARHVPIPARHEARKIVAAHTPCAVRLCLIPLQRTAHRPCYAWCPVSAALTSRKLFFGRA